MSKLSCHIFKVYDPNLPDNERPEYWDRKMEDLYFSDPGRFVKIISNSTVFSFLAAHIPSRGLILDGGCGSNYIANIFDTKDRRIVGLDFAAGNLMKGKEIYPEGLAVAGDLNRLPFADSSFDCVISMSSAEHLECGPRLLFEETRRVLKKGCPFLLFIPTFNIEDVIANIAGFLKAPQKGPLKSIPHFESDKLFRVVTETKYEEEKGFFAYWFCRRLIMDMLTTAGFDVKKCVPLDVAGGLMRSRIFRKFARRLVLNSMQRLVDMEEKTPAGLASRIFILEDIYHNRLHAMVHNLVGTFYRYGFGFVCL